MKHFKEIAIIVVAIAINFSGCVSDEEQTTCPSDATFPESEGCLCDESHLVGEEGTFRVLIDDNLCIFEPVNICFLEEGSNLTPIGDGDASFIYRDMDDGSRVIVRVSIPFGCAEGWEHCDAKECPCLPETSVAEPPLCL